MNEIIKRSSINSSNSREIIKKTYTPESAIFIDEMGKRYKGYFCKGCMKVGLELDFRYFQNYGGFVKKSYLCDECFSLLSSVSDRVARERKHIGHAWLG